MNSFGFAGKGWFQTFTVRNWNSPRGLLRKCLLSNSQADFQSKPAQKILKIMCMLGAGAVFKAIWSHKHVNYSISSIHEHFIEDI